MKITLSSGISLLEMLVALSIVAILAAISIPLMHDFVQRTQDDVLLQQLSSTLQLAQQQARARHVAISICKSKDGHACDGDWQQGQIMFVDPERTGFVQQAEQIISVNQSLVSHGELYWRSFPYYREFIHFIPVNSLQSDNGTFWHCHAHSLRWALMLSRFGKTRIVLPDKNGQINDGHGESLSCNS